MSIKIYDGHRMPEISLSDYMHRCIKARNEMRILLENAHDRYVINLLLTFFERGDSDVFTKANEEVYRQYEKSRKNLKSVVDYDVTWNVMPYKNYFYIRVFFHNFDSLLTPIWLKYFPESEEYPYWDNSNKPENVSQDLWNERESNWRGAYGGDFGSSTASHSLTFSVYSTYESPLWASESVRNDEYVNSPESNAIRVKVHVDKFRDQLFKEFCEEKNVILTEFNFSVYNQFVYSEVTKTKLKEFEKTVALTPITWAELKDK